MPRPRKYPQELIDRSVRLAIEFGRVAPQAAVWLRRRPGQAPQAAWSGSAGGLVNVPGARSRAARGTFATPHTVDVPEDVQIDPNGTLTR